MTLVKVKDDPGLVRDLRTNAVLNTDANNLERYKVSRRHNQKTLEKQKSMEEELSQIKQMLSVLIERLPEK